MLKKRLIIDEIDSISCVIIFFGLIKLGARIRILVCSCTCNCC